MNLNRLRMVIQRSLNNTTARNAFHKQAADILVHLGLSETESYRFLDQHLSQQTIPDLPDLEERLQEDLAALHIYERLQERMEQRAQDWLEVVRPHLKSGLRILDLGGGSGEFGKLLADEGCEVTVADVQDRRCKKAQGLRFALETDYLLPSLDGEAFDLVLLVTVLHHADDVERLVELADKMAGSNGKILVIESVAERGWFGYVALIDWFYNHILHFNQEAEEKVNVPCNFHTAADWENMFERLTGRRYIVSEPLMIFMKLNPEPHHKFVF